MARATPKIKRLTMARISTRNISELRAIDANGDSGVGWTYKLQKAGTTTDIDLTTDLAGTIPALISNRTSDSDGIFQALYFESEAVKIVIYDDAGVEFSTYDDILSSPSETLFDTYADAVAADILPTINAIRTAGRTTIGDGGDALYVRVSTEPTHAFKLQSADGAHWVGVPVNARINEKQIGESGAGNDDTSVLQDTHDAALALGCDCLFIGPDLKATSIKIGSNSSTARPPDVYGVGIGYNGQVNLGHGTRIVSTSSTLPLIVFEGLRRGRLFDITLKSSIDITTSNFDKTGIEPTQESYWDGIYGARDAIAPYAGVAVDPYLLDSGSTPSGAYPGQTYHSLLSSDIWLQNVEIMGFPVGVVVQPSGANANNGDFLKLYNCCFTTCRDAISIGTSQHRNLDARACIFNRVQWWVATDLHGSKTGRIAGKFDNCSGGGYVGGLFSVQGLATPGPVVFDTCYLESLHRIGDINGNVAAGEGTIVFENCLLSFRHESQDVHPSNILGGHTVAGGSSVVRNRGVKVFSATRFEGVNEIASMVAPNVIFRNGSYVNPELTTVPEIKSFLFAYATGDILAPLAVQEDIFDGQDFQSAPSAPTSTNVTLTIVSVSGTTVTFTGHPSYATYGDGSLIRDRLGECFCMVVTGDGQGRLITNHSGGEVIDTLDSSFSASFILLS